ncbi:MAG: hypothetical protein AAFP22_09115, partial [Planctomycetota bacterium]
FESDSHEALLTVMLVAEQHRLAQQRARAPDVASGAPGRRGTVRVGARHAGSVGKLGEASGRPGNSARIAEIRAAIERLDAPPPVRRIPPRRRPGRG